MNWEEYCKSGSCWVTQVELEFHHVMVDPDDPQGLSPFPSHAVNVPNDSRSGFLLWLTDGTPAHARWCADIQEFKRIGDEKAIDRALVRAWAAIPFPVAKS